MVRELLRSVVGVTSARVMGAVVQLLTVAVLIRLLGPSAFGSFVLFRGTTQVLMVVSDLGIGMSIEKRLSESRNERIVSTGILLKFPLVILVGLAIHALSGQISAYLGLPLSTILILSVAAASLDRTMKQALKGIQEVTAATTIKTAERAIVLVFGGIVAWAGGGVKAVIFVLIGSFVFGAIVCTVLLPMSFSRPSAETARSLFRFSKFGVFPSVVGPIVFSWTDTLMVGLFLPPEFVSAYEAAWKLSKTTTLLSGAIATTSFPHISRWNENDRMDRIGELIPPALTGSLLIVIPTAVGVFFVSESLLKTLFGASTGVASVALIILVAARVPLSVTNVLSRVNLGMGRPELVASGSVLMIIVNVSGNLLLIYMYGLVGAASATAVSAFVTAVYQWRVATNLVEFRFPMRNLGVLTAATGVMVVVLLFLDICAPTREPLSTVLLITTGALVYSSVLLVYPGFRNVLRSSLGL